MNSKSVVPYLCPQLWERSLVQYRYIQAHALTHMYAHTYIYMCIYVYIHVSTFSFVLSCSVVSDSLLLYFIIVARQAPLSMGFPRQEYWNGLPFPSPEDPLNPGIKPGSPALQVDS